MACPSCGSSRPATPVVQAGAPTIWAWLTPSENLIAISSSEALQLLNALNGPVS